MKVAVKLFARAKDLAGSGLVELELPEQSRVSELRQSLVEQCPKLGPLLSQLLIAVNNDYARDDAILPAGAEVACFPPVSGG